MRGLMVFATTPTNSFLVVVLDGAAAARSGERDRLVGPETRVAEEAADDRAGPAKSAAAGDGDGLAPCEA